VTGGAARWEMSSKIEKVDNWFVRRNFLALAWARRSPNGSRRMSASFVRAGVFFILVCQEFCDEPARLQGRAGFLFGLFEPLLGL